MLKAETMVSIMLRLKARSKFWPWHHFGLKGLTFLLLLIVNWKRR